MNNSEPSNVQWPAWWESWWAILSLLVLSVLPIIVVPLPPFTDVLGHVGRYAVQLQIQESPTLREYYDYELRLIGNLGVDLFVQAFGPTLGIFPVVKWVTASIPPLTIFGFVLVSRQLLGRIPATIGFAAIFSLSMPLLLGFLNFTLSVALALHAFALWIWLDRKAWYLAKWLAFLGIGSAVYICHVFGWGILGLLVFGYEWRKAGRPDLRNLLLVIRAGLKTIPLWLPFLHIIFWRSSISLASGSETLAFSLDRKLWAIFISLRDQSLLPDTLILAPVLLIIVQAIRKNDFRFDFDLAAIFIPLAIAFALLPGTVFGSLYADTRLAPLLIALLLLAIKPQVSANAVAIVGFGLFAARAATVTFSSMASYSQIERSFEILDQLPTGSRLLQLNGEPCRDWGHSPLQMLGSYHILKSQGFSNGTWDMGGGNPLTVLHDVPFFYRDDPQSATRQWGCKNVHQRFFYLYENLPRGSFDYLLVLEPPKSFSPKPGDLLIEKTSKVALYRLSLDPSD